ncbi:hypothetical protein [Deminuibacter soli]|uniref:Tetratricopeptide repeat protein n=1 Tax=Deminuibacter soli TaxID=2291815 RepID=A0A3E1NKV9_9BACT|nr:hypothetical protein [Deminuibacter soli]RFM28537.1 hypothetical protein DXN05_06945 [Deminuibacter soli]
MARKIISGQALADARAVEAKGSIAEAIATYQRMHAQVPDDNRVVSRLLILLRKQKDYKGELQLINETIRQYEQGLQASRDAWLKAHRKSARTSLSLAKALNLVSPKGKPLYQDPFITSLHKRKTTVQLRLK